MYKIVLFLFLTIININAFETEYDLGRTLYYAKGCANCHGTEAEGSSYYPKLAEKKEKFIVQRLQEFQKGVARSQKAEIMFTFANALNKKEIIQISKFLSKYKKDTTDKYKVSDDILGSVD